jgi:hypothetical protein
MGCAAKELTEGRNVFGNRVITGAIILAGSVFAAGLFADNAAAQYEPVGKPLQLVPVTNSGKPISTQRSRASAKKAAKSEAKSETKSASKSELKTSEVKAETKQHASLRRRRHPHTEMAEQKQPQHPTTPEAETPAAQAAVAAPAAMTAPAPQPAPAPAPAQAANTELMIGGQAVQVRSPDEANELDLAANTPSLPASPPPSTSSGSAQLYNLAATNPPTAHSTAATGIDALAPPTAPPAAAGNAALAATPTAPTAPAAAEPAFAAAQTASAAQVAAAAEADSAKTEVSQSKNPVGSTSWLMQVMAALGGAVAAGSAAWFLIGSASPRIKLSEWQEADGE